MKAVGYIRVSTEEQAKHGVSLDAQRAKIQAYAALEDMELIGIEADEGISGCSIKGRPAIQRVLQMVRDRQVKAVVIFKLDRLARNTVEALDIAKLFDKHNVALHSITEKLDTRSALGRFFFTLLASLAEMERGLISERIQAAMETKRFRNEALNNNPEFGFRVVDGKVIPDLEEQKTIQRVRSLHRGGHTIYSIISVLTQEGTFNRRGKPFGKTQIHALIRRKAA
jgi:site-specific DNA recombinase